MLLPILISILAAVIPTLIYILLFYWADRYEREPIWLAVVAFVWGAAPAVLVSALGELLLEGPGLGPTGAQNALVGNVIIAPVIEETAKWIALLAIFFFRRQEFDGPLDGLVYGALIGFGFAMTENLLFFLGAYGQGGYEALSSVFVVRAIIFGMNHAFYTALAGIALGIARNAGGAGTRGLWMVAGLLLAIAAHSLHNLGASLSAVGESGFTLSMAVSIASLTLVALSMLWSWKHERAVIRAELADEIGVALTADEYRTLTQRWRQPVRRKAPGARVATERRQLCVELALHKDRRRRRGQREPELDGQIRALRDQLTAGMAKSSQDYVTLRLHDTVTG